MRVFLGGKSVPRSEFALEGSGIDTSGGTAFGLLLEDGEIFAPADYISLGYTNFEVWCIGAAGGLGSGDIGSLGTSVTFDKVTTTEVMPSDIWNAYMNYWRLTHQMSGADPIYGYKPDGSPLTMEEAFEQFNPSHTLQVFTFSNPHPAWSHETAGGAGGGGGIHRAGGLLADLPSSVLVEVGQVGADAPPGQSVVNGLWTPVVDSWYKDMVWGRILDASLDSVHPPGSTLRTYYDTLLDFQNRYPLPHTSFPVGQVGGDGGPSSFGAISQASGGKGGHPVKSWSGSAFVVDNLGGEGGLGDQVTAGGGAAGGTSTNTRGKDGVWDRDAIGQGGGGGYGGGSNSGGKGSFSYADTSVYGPGQSGGNLPSATAADHLKTAPGGGGGARINKTLKYGSKALGYNPNGAVFIRMFKID